MILYSGDGTLHELMTGIGRVDPRLLSAIPFVMLPGGSSSECRVVSLPSPWCTTSGRVSLPWSVRACLSFVCACVPFVWACDWACWVVTLAHVLCVSVRECACLRGPHVCLPVCDCWFGAG